MSEQFLHNSAGAIDIPVSHEKTIKQNLWKQRNRNDGYDFMTIKNRKRLAGKHQPSVSFNLSNVLPRIKLDSPQKGALKYFSVYLLTV